jgi:hypothetical protein
MAAVAQMPPVAQQPPQSQPKQQLKKAKTFQVNSESSPITFHLPFSLIRPIYPRVPEPTVAPIAVQIWQTIMRFLVPPF